MRGESFPDDDPPHLGPRRALPAADGVRLARPRPQPADPVVGGTVKAPLPWRITRAVLWLAIAGILGAVVLHSRS